MSYPEILRSDETRAFWAHLKTLCLRAVPPRARDLELMDIYHLAPIVTLLDFLPSEGRMRVRYAGTRIVEMFDQETTGLYLDEVDLGPHKDGLVGVYIDCLKAVRPYWSLGNVEITRDEGYGYQRLIAFDYERLMFPMRDDDGAVTRVASILVRHKARTVEGGFVSEALAYPDVRMRICRTAVDAC